MMIFVFVGLVILVALTIYGIATLNKDMDGY